MIPDWVSTYIGIPFLSGGRDRLGLDCYGLVRLILIEQYNISWPVFDNHYTNAHDKVQTSTILSENKPLLQGIAVAIPNIGDVVLMTYSGYLCHMGMYIGENKIIHIERHINSVVDRLDGLKLKNRIEGYYHVC